MLFSVSYYLLVLVFAVVTGGLLTVVLLRRHWVSPPTELQVALAGMSHASSEEQLYQNYLLPLLVYEEEYPSFSKILGAVFSSFPLRRFMKKEEFSAALESVRGSVFQRAQPARVETAMATIVNCFLRDPDVEYECRQELSVLVPGFLGELRAWAGRRLDQEPVSQRGELPRGSRPFSLGSANDPRPGEMIVKAPTLGVDDPPK